MVSKRVLAAVVVVALFGCGSQLAAQSLAAASADRRTSEIESILNRLAAEAEARMPAPHSGTRGAHAKDLCFPTDISLCLLGRFVVVAVWDNPFANPNDRLAAGALQLTDSSGYMWFLDSSDMEVPIKILDFCDQGVFKVFAAGLTDFGVGVGVLDQISGVQKNYINADFNRFNTVIDESPPFPCP